VGIRWGLCCQFADGGVRFRQATHRYVATLEPPARLSYLRDIARSNAIALAHAVARPGDILSIAAGHYPETLIIDKRLKVVPTGGTLVIGQ